MTKNITLWLIAASLLSFISAGWANVPPSRFAPESMPSTTHQIQQNNESEAITTMQAQTNQNQILANQQMSATPYVPPGLQQEIIQTQQALNQASQQQKEGQLPASSLSGLQASVQQEQAAAELPLPPTAEYK